MLPERECYLTVSLESILPLLILIKALSAWLTYFERVSELLHPPKASSDRLAKGLSMYRRILIATDGSEASQAAVKHGLLLAKALGAEVTAMTATLSYDASPLWEAAISKTPEGYEKRVQARAAKILSSVAETAASLGVEVETAVLDAKHPWMAIVDTAATRKCDLIVMASHGWQGVAAVILGSETQKVLAHSKIPVLVHRS